MQVLGIHVLSFHHTEIISLTWYSLILLWSSKVALAHPWMTTVGGRELYIYKDPWEALDILALVCRLSLHHGFQQSTDFGYYFGMLCLSLPWWVFSTILIFNRPGSKLEYKVKWSTCRDGSSRLTKHHTWSVHMFGVNSRFHAPSSESPEKGGLQGWIQASQESNA